MIPAIRFTGTNTPIMPEAETKQPIPVSLSRLYKQFKALPPDLQDKILAPRPTLVEDVFALQHPKNKQEALEQQLKINLLTRHTQADSAENDPLLERSWLSGYQSLFDALLQTTENPTLPSLIEKAVLAQNNDAFNKLVSKVKAPLPTSTLQWVADCGQPGKLRKLLALSPLSASEKKELWKQALQQQQNIQEHSEDSLEGRQGTLYFIAGGSPYRPFQKMSVKEIKEYLQYLESGNSEYSEKFDECVQRRHILALLQTPGIDINHAIAGLRGTPLMAAAAQPYTPILKALLQAPGIEINKIMTSKSNGSYAGQTALHVAAESNQPENIKALLQRPDIQSNLKDRDLDTPLHLAAQKGNTNCVEALLQAPDVEPNQKNQLFRLTPLHIAAKNGNTACVKALLKSPKVDINTRGGVSNDTTALNFALNNGHHEIARLLRAHNAEESQTVSQLLQELANFLDQVGF